jgi:hypothetical protein
MYDMYSRELNTWYCAVCIAENLTLGAMCIVRIRFWLTLAMSERRHGKDSKKASNNTHASGRPFKLYLLCS